jgi:phage terminase large subunit-like protein
MTESGLRNLIHDWPFWARANQLPPEGAWLVWLFLGGRGAGKTRAGAEWIRQQVQAGCRRIGLIAPTLNDAREVMIGGASGLATIGHPDDRPAYEISRRRLVWPNGAQGFVFSAEDPDSLRGPQFDAAWADEFAAWSYPQATLDTLRMGLRLGDQPRLVITTTPRPIPALKALVKAPGIVTTQAATQDNAAYLANGLDEADERYRIEFYAEGALFHSDEVVAPHLDIVFGDLENWLGSPPQAFNVVIRQVSASFGPGRAATLTITS